MLSLFNSNINAKEKKNFVSLKYRENYQILKEAKRWGIHTINVLNQIIYTAYFEEIFGNKNKQHMPFNSETPYIEICHK